MNVKELAEKLNLNIIVEGDLDREVTGGYCGDLLSWVMGRAQSGDCWLTVMGNLNCVAVAVLADCACIVLTESATLDEDAKKRALMQDVTILSTDKSTFSVALSLGELL